MKQHRAAGECVGTHPVSERYPGRDRFHILILQIPEVTHLDCQTKSDSFRSLQM